MNLSACLEADFQGGRAYSAGGVGPMFRERRIEEPFSVWEMFSRAVTVLDKLGVNDLVSVFIDDEEIPFEDDDEGSESDDIFPEDLAGAVRDVYGDGEPNSFLVMFTFDDKQFSHTITIEGYVDHPYDESGITVLDRASTLDEEEDGAAEKEASDEESYRDETMQGADEVYEDEGPDDNGKLFAALEQFMAKLQSALDQSMALQEPEVEIWYDDEEGVSRAPEQTSLGGNW
jgi:hypothetical protein